MSWFQQNAPPQQPQQGSLGSLGGGNAFDTYKPFPLPQQWMQPGWDPRNEIGPHDPKPYPQPPSFKDGPQPVPGMPPMPWTPNEHWNDPGGAQDGNRGSGQPINQLMGPPGSQGGPLPADAGPMPQFGPYGGGYDQNTHQWVNNTQPVGIAPTPRQMGSLQSLGGGQLNQSGMVNLRGPDGSSKAVPQSDLAHWLSKGAVRV